jgi:hypothetical protein
MNTKEKTTLRQVPQGVVATIDERPKIGEYHLEDNQILNIFPNYLTDLNACDKVIASTFGVGKSIQYSKHDKVLTEGVITVTFGKEYEYTEKANQVIIKL